MTPNAAKSLEEFRGRLARLKGLTARARKTLAGRPLSELYPEEVDCPDHLLAGDNSKLWTRDESMEWARYQLSFQLPWFVTAAFEYAVGHVTKYPDTPERALTTAVVYKALVSVPGMPNPEYITSDEGMRKFQTAYNTWLFPILCHTLRYTLDVFEDAIDKLERSSAE
jgi:hypothetical protein